MQPFTSVTGVAIPLIEDDVNTDQIAPVGGGPRLNQNYADVLFSNRRKRDGAPDPQFVFNKPQFARPSILVTGRNFGCGSSRESAVWAMMAVGIRCIVARSFADIYRENCLQNGVLPVVLSSADADALEARVLASDGAENFTADLEQQRIVCPDGAQFGFELPAADRMRLLEGLDDIGLSLKLDADIAEWEKRTASQMPWMQRALPG
jgi:3-isopropylmalate/(R)-2-methylmalate dehydratase small subunit